MKRGEIAYSPPKKIYIDIRCLLDEKSRKRISQLESHPVITKIFNTFSKLSLHENTARWWINHEEFHITPFYTRPEFKDLYEKLPLYITNTLMPMNNWTLTALHTNSNVLAVIAPGHLLSLTTANYVDWNDDEFNTIISPYSIRGLMHDLRR